MGKNIDATYIQMRMLNTGKGPAVRALRAQADKWQYHEHMKPVLKRRSLKPSFSKFSDNLIAAIVLLGPDW